MFLFFLGAPSSSNATPQKSFEKIAQQADDARTSDHIQNAIDLYAEGVRLRPAWSEGWWSLGTLFYDQDLFADAAVAFRHFIATSPKPAPAYAFLGLCEYETHDYDQALQHFRTWARYGWSGTPELIDVATLHLALLLTRERRFIEALYLLATEVQRRGSNPALIEAMGLASLRIAHLPEDSPPEQREMVWLAGRAAVYMALPLQEFGRADEYSRRLLLHYGQVPGIHYFRGTVFKFEHKNDEARTEFEEELRISPRQVPALLELARSDIQSGPSAEAESLAKTATLIEPKNPDAHHVLGQVLFVNGRFQESARAMETAQQLAPDVPSIRYHLVRVYQQLGRSKDAEDELAMFKLLKRKKDVFAPPEEKLDFQPQQGGPRN